MLLPLAVRRKYYSMSKRKKANKRSTKKTPLKAATSKRTATPKAAAAPYESKLFFKETVSKQDDLLKKIFLGLSAFIALVTLLLAINSGINGDDSFQNDYSDKIVNFYTSMGQDTSCFYHPKGPIQYYGGVFELTAGVVNSTFGFEANDTGYHQVRHILNALFGILAMIFTGLFARTIGGWRAAILALTLVFLSPRFLGHSLMNPKDIPFAAGTIVALYYMAVFVRQLPKPSVKTLVGLAAGIGIAFGARAGGLLMVAYLGMFTGLAFVLKYGWGAIFAKGKTTLQYIGYAVVPTIAGIIFGILVWPYAMVDPLNHIPESLSGLTKYAINIRMLFGGEMIYGKDVPVYYLPLWILQTVPLYVHLGLLAMVIFIRQLFKKYTPFYLFMALFAFIFPIFYVIIQKSTLYDGWRHLIFAYPPMVALVAVTWNFLLEKFETKKALTYAVIGVLALTALEPALFIARNYAYPYVYFNALSGGMKGAYGDYETDYWGVSVKQAVEWMEDQGIISENMTDTVTVASNFSYQLDKYLRNKKYNGKIRTRYVRFRQRYDRDWDYGIFLSRFVRGSHIDKGTWPPKEKTIHTINANGIPLLAIIKSEEDFAVEGIKASKKRDYTTAISLMEKETAKYPSNEIAWTTLANAYLSTNQMEKAKTAAENAINIEPENLQAHNSLGLYYLRSNKIKEGVEVFQKTLEFEPKNALAYYYLATVKQNQNELTDALELAKKSIEVNSKFREGYLLAANIYEKMGDATNAARYREAVSRIK